MPKITVIMPLYNAEKYVKESIYSILKQDYEDFELLLIDDCSTDSTMEIVELIKDKRIKILKNKTNKGIAYSRNVGLKNARGKYIALMDDDDIAPPNRFKKEVELLDCQREYDAVGGRFCVIDAEGNVVSVMPEPFVNPKYIRANLMFRDVLGNGSMMFRSEVANRNSIIFHEYYGMEDYRFWIDFSIIGNITNINEIMLYWRNWDNMTTRMSNSECKRAEKFSKLQEYALLQNGFKLSEMDLKILSNTFTEHFWEKIVTVDDLHKVYFVMKKLISQSEELELDFKEELRILLMKLFSKRTELSELW